MAEKSSFLKKRTWGPTPKYERVENYKRINYGHIFIAGPCSVETEKQIHEIAEAVASFGANHLRGGVFRAGTYPGAAFGWVDEKLIQAYYNAAKKNNLKNIIEILDYSDFEWVLKYCDCVQVGARQMQNYTLLKKLAETGKRVFLKRNPGSTLDEFLGAAEWLLYHGCKDLVLIERGGSTNLNHVRWDLSISIIPSVKLMTNIPIIVDASHGTGRRDLVEPMTLAGIAAGADGCLVEVHTSPKDSLSDSDQAIEPSDYVMILSKAKEIMKTIKGDRRYL